MPLEEYEKLLEDKERDLKKMENLFRQRIAAHEIHSKKKLVVAHTGYCLVPLDWCDYGTEMKIKDTDESYISLRQIFDRLAGVME